MKLVVMTISTYCIEKKWGIIFPLSRFMNILFSQKHIIPFLYIIIFFV